MQSSSSLTSIPPSNSIQASTYIPPSTSIPPTICPVCNSCPANNCSCPVCSSLKSNPFINDDLVDILWTWDGTKFNPPAGAAVAETIVVPNPTKEINSSSTMIEQNTNNSK